MNPVSTLSSPLRAGFFLLNVFAIHTRTVLERGDFYDSIGIEPQASQREVMHRANVTAERAVSSVRDTAYPKFFQYLDKCATANQKLAAISHSQCPQLIKLIQKLPWLVVIMWQLLGLYFLPGINTEHTRPEIY